MISIVIPCLNSCSKIIKTLSSINGQNKKCLEIILADGGSQDDSVKVFKRYCKANSIKHSVLINKNEKSISETLYIAFSMSRGEYIYQLCVGDLLFDKTWIGFANTFLTRNKKYDGVWARTILMTENGMPCKIFPPLAFRDIPFGYKFIKFWLKYNISPPDNTLVIKKDLLLKYFKSEKNDQNPFGSINPHAVFNYRVCSNGFNFKFVDKLVHICFVAKNTRSHKLRSLLKETEKNLKNKKNIHFLNCTKEGFVQIKGKNKKIKKTERLKILLSLVISQFPTYRFFQFSVPELLKFTKKSIIKKTNYWD